MRLGFNYDNLLTNLVDVSNVVADSLVPEDMRNIIFRVTANSVTLIGATPIITFKKELSFEDVTIDISGDAVNEDGELYLQIKAKELLDFLNTYKSTKLTVIDEVILEYGASDMKLKCTVVESTKTESEFDEVKSFSSQWVFDNLKIKPNVMPYVKLALPDEASMHDLPFSAFSIHTKQMLPILQSGTTSYSYIMFDRHYAFLLHSAFTMFMINQTEQYTDVFAGVKFSQRIVNFIEKIASTSADDTIKVAKDDTYIYIRTSNKGDIYIKYDNKIVGYKQYLDMFKKDNCVVLNRFYLREVLKRLSLINDSIEFSIKPHENIITLKNSKFTQDIELINMKGFEGVDKVTFKIMPDILNKAIICDDLNEAAGSDTVYIYYCNSGSNSAEIYFSDSLGVNGENAWLTFVRVKTY